MKTKFEREERYIVIKLSDIQEEVYSQIEEIIENNCIELRECVVVESDWPIYEKVWKMIERMA